MSPRSNQQGNVTSRIIIHGGAGNITRKTISHEQYNEYQDSLRRILASAVSLLSKGAEALDVATHAVSLLEDDPLYNSGKGAVFTRAGTNELECSIMVSNGYRKRGVGLMMLKHIKNPIKLAREVLIRGELEDGGGAKDHCEYSGEFIEGLAEKWGLEIVDPEYFFTQKKWDEHKRGLKEEEKKRKSGIVGDAISDWERENYVPLGTCGAVVLDSFGTVCAATSTGGLTNKVPGRIGDTPTMGAGYWAEEWAVYSQASHLQMLYQRNPKVASSPLDQLSRGNVRGLMQSCLSSLSPGNDLETCTASEPLAASNKPQFIRHAVGLSGSGNGDSFLRLAAARTAAARSRFTSSTLASSVSWMSGPGGELQRSAGNRWGHVHEGVGGIIGIELAGNKSFVVCDFNCGGMFRAWTEDNGEQKCLIFKEDGYESGPKE